MARDDDILQELREQTKWLRLLGYTALKPMLQDALKNDKHKLVYEFSNGARTSREVAALAGVGPGTVSKLWTDWLAMGICTESPQQAGRKQHLAPLSQLGIELPTSAKAAASANATGPGANGSVTDDEAKQADDE